MSDSMKETLLALGDLGDFLGGVGVIVTLIYLAIQVRQNTLALGTASRQAVAAGMRESIRLRLDRASALAWGRGLRVYPDQPFDEQNRFGILLTDEALFFQGAFALHDSGQLDDSTYNAYLDWFASAVATPGGTQWWESLGKPVFAPAMVEAVDERLARGGLHDIFKLPGFRPEDLPDE